MFIRLHCMGLLRAPVCYLDDCLHRWFPWTFSDHWGERPEKRHEPWICELHGSLADRYWQKRLGDDL